MMKTKNVFLILCLPLFFSGCQKDDIVGVQKLINDDSILKNDKNDESKSETSVDLKKETYVGKMYFHDQPPGQSMDIYMADLYIALKDAPNTQTAYDIPLGFGLRTGRLEYGQNQIWDVEFQGRKLAKVSIGVVHPIDFSAYKFVVRNVENLTNSPGEDSSVNVNGRNWIVFVSNRTGNFEIFFMDTATRVSQQLTPINGRYGGSNFDPEWKSDDVIVWSHEGRTIEVDIKTMAVNGDVIPGWDYQTFDPKYSPDRTKIVFSAWIKGRKNGYEKDFVNGKITQILPTPYAAHVDDNPAWIFSSSKLSGHVFFPGNNGRIYIKDGDEFLWLITPAEKDFRYVTPVKILGRVFLVFSDYSNGIDNIILWIVNQDGSCLRPLNQRGDEAVFYALNLPPPREKADLKTLADKYLQGFNRNN